MSFFKPKLVLLAAASLLLPILAIGACTGGEFAGSDNPSSGGSSSGGASNQGGSTVLPQAGSVGTGAGSGVACDGPEDCDDKDACTVDQCNADGTCDASPMCTGTEICCDGDCAECCSNADCDDGVSCTGNTCFANQCMYIPDDAQCDASQYCSTTDGCRAKQVCGLQGDVAADECSDESACTTDSCVENFCKHDFCAASTLCCETGCAEDCCSDSQCNSDDDPCTVGSCEGGKCSLVPLCEGNMDCCPSADGQTATCGSCCSAEDCNDNVGCTKDQCGVGQCSHTPDDTECPVGYYCDPDQMECQKAAECDAASDCHAAACQTNPRCEGGTCKFDGCGNGTHCCPNGNGCAICCGDAECSDNIGCTQDSCAAAGCKHVPDDSLCQGLMCDAQLGCIGCREARDCDDGLTCTDDVCSMQTNTCSHTSICKVGEFCTPNGCSQCTYDSDCQGGVITNIIPPIGTECPVSRCIQGMCSDVIEDCGDFQVCCQPFGCALQCGIDPVE